jgi:hypothetical protein
VRFQICRLRLPCNVANSKTADRLQTEKPQTKPPTANRRALYLAVASNRDDPIAGAAPDTHDLTARSRSAAGVFGPKR